MFEHMAFSETALLAALHDEKIRELIGRERAGAFYERMVRYDAELWADINQELFSRGVYWDLPTRFHKKVSAHAKEFIRLKGPTPMERSEDPPESPWRRY